jgi:hypothetical protein
MFKMIIRPEGEEAEQEADRHRITKWGGLSLRRTLQ